MEKILLIGNKADLKEQMKVQAQEGENEKNLNGKTKEFFECSAKNDTNIQEIFKEVIRLLYNPNSFKKESNCCCSCCFHWIYLMI